MPVAATPLLQRIGTFFTRLTAPLPFIDDEHERQRSHVFSLGGLSGIVFSLLISCYVFISNDPSWRRGLALLMLFGFIISFGISRTRHYVWGKLAINALVLILVLVNSYFVPATSSLMAMLIFIYVAGFYDKLRYALVNWLIAACLVLFVMAWRPGDWADSGIFAMTLIIIGAITILQMSITRSVQRKLVSQKQELALSQTRLRAAIDSSLHMFLLLDPIRDETGKVVDYEVIDANARAQALYGIRPGNRLNSDTATQLEPRFRQALVASFLTVLENQQPLTGEYTFPGQRHFEYQVVPVGDDLAFSTNDITDRKLAEAQRFALQAEQQRVATLQNMVSNLSHDFNTRLSVMRLSVSTAQQTTDLAQVHTKLTRIGDYTEQLIGMVADMLQLSRLDEMTILELTLCQTNLAGMLERVVSSYQKNNARKQLLSLTVEPHISPVWADEHLIEAAVSHVINNAVKFAPQGGTIRVGCRQNERHVFIEVQDNGSGIAETDLPHIFERFFRGAAHRPTDGGFGLGLTIAKRIVEAHDGTIQAENIPQSGALVRIALPMLNGGQPIP